jgi:hypothetical protein
MGAGDEDDEEDNWEKIPDFVKERNVIIPLGHEDYLTIPMPLGFNVLPNIGRKAVEMMMHDDPTEGRGKHVGDLARIILDSFNPFGGSENLGQLAAPTVFDPAVGLMQNRDWTGRQIYRADQSSLDPTPGFSRTKDSASAFGKGLAEIMNKISGGNDYRPGAISWTPDQIDYVIGQLTGGVGRELMKVEQTLTAPLTGEDLPSYKIPILGRLYGNARGLASHSEKFYENVRSLNIVENEIRGRAGDGEDVDKLLAEDPLAPLIGAGNAAEAQMRKLRAARRAVIAGGLDGYLDEVRTINDMQGEVMKDLNRQVRQAKSAAQRWAFAEQVPFCGTEQAKKKPLDLSRGLILLVFSGSPTWTRTRDLRINSPSLYQLSYQGTASNYSGVFGGFWARGVTAPLKTVSPWRAERCVAQQGTGRCGRIGRVTL